MITIVVVSKIESYKGIEEEQGAAGLWVFLKVQSIKPKCQLPWCRLNIHHQKYIHREHTRAEMYRTLQTSILISNEYMSPWGEKEKKQNVAYRIRFISGVSKVDYVNSRSNF